MNRYEHAIKEFQSENENGKSKLVYAYFGLAVYMGQCLEETLCQMLWSDKFFKQKGKKPKILNKIIDEYETSKKTMGAFIKEVKKSYSISESEKQILEDVLKKRNYIVHNFFKFEVQKCFSETGQKEILKYFCSFIEKCQQIDQTLQTYHSLNIERLGVTQESITQLFTEMKAIERARDGR